MLRTLTVTHLKIKAQKPSVFRRLMNFFSPTKLVSWYYIEDLKFLSRTDFEVGEKLLINNQYFVQVTGAHSNTHDYPEFLYHIHAVGLIAQTKRPKKTDLMYVPIIKLKS